jgi:ATP-dependent DNA helicase RecQ
LLRSYEGIFDQEVNIQEKSIAHRLKKELAEVKQLLTQLAQYKVISYQPVKDTPQIYFLQNRVKGENLQIDLQRYNERKKAYKIRIEAMIGYAHQQECRSQLIGNYFGDEAIKPCGICDNCLRKKSGELSQEEFSRIENQILTALRVKPVHSKLLLEHINGFKKEKAWQVIAFLQSEKKILVSGTGMISLNGK